MRKDSTYPKKREERDDANVLNRADNWLSMEEVDPVLRKPVEDLDAGKRHERSNKCSVNVVPKHRHRQTSLHNPLVSTLIDALNLTLAKASKEHLDASAYVLADVLVDHRANHGI